MAASMALPGDFLLSKPGTHREILRKSVKLSVLFVVIYPLSL
jgi:hypothetical protein